MQCHADRSEARHGPIRAGASPLQMRPASPRLMQYASMLDPGRPEPARTGLSGGAPVQCAGFWDVAGFSALALGGLAIAAGSPLLGTLGVLGGLGALYMGSGQDTEQPRRSANYGTRARSGSATDPDWYGSRERTAYGYTNSDENVRLQGPHTVPHIGKRVMAENAVNSGTGFDPEAISERTGVIPSAGQSRRLMREYEQRTGIAIPDDQKRDHDTAYRQALANRSVGSHDERVAATRQAMELSPLSTYAHGRMATHDEIKGKGERRNTVANDLTLMGTMSAQGPMPAFRKVDLPQGASHNPDHLRKMMRDIGRMNLGQDDLSEFELSSDDEYTATS